MRRIQLSKVIGSSTIAVVALALVPLAPPAVSVAEAGLPVVSSGARPGPDVLYAPAPAAPQLENVDSHFTAAPLLVSGHEAYIGGEYLYQDFLYDDYGSDTDGQGAFPLSPRSGDITYPTNDARYGGNAADIVEFRIAANATEVAYRVTLNTLLEADSTIIAIAFDADHSALTGVATLPRDPGAPFPGTDEVIFIWGAGAEHRCFSTSPTCPSPPMTTSLTVTTDLLRNQLTVIVPRSVSNPTTTWSTIVAAGLYDPVGGGWLRPQQDADADTPGGAGNLDSAPCGIFNLAFRFTETMLCMNPSPISPCDVPPDSDQSMTLRNKTPQDYAHDINFATLTAGTGNSSTVPASGIQVRMFASRLALGEGRGPLPVVATGEDGTFPQYKGQLQPYSLYIPTTYTASTPAGLTLNLHSLGEHYWQYHGATMVQQIGEQRGNLVATSLSRGPDGWYQNSGEYDVFEMWADVAAHFNVDSDHVASSGYSMGGYATYRLASLYPDLFGKAFSQVGPPGDGIWVPPAAPTGGIETLTNLWLENVRNIPYLNLVAQQDELVPYAGPRAQNLGAPEFGIRGFDQLGYRFRFLTAAVSDHLAMAANGYDFPLSTAFLGDAAVDRNPPHVTFAYVPDADDAALGLVHDHAYWASQLTLRDTAGGSNPAKGVVDALSHAFGVGDPTSFSGASAGTLGPFAYSEVNRSWNPAPAIPAENILDVTLTNLASVHLDMARASLDPARTLTVNVTADGDGVLALDGAFPAGSVVLRDGLVVSGASAGPAGATIPVVAGTDTYQIVQGLELRKVTLRFRPGDDRLTLKGRIAELLAMIPLPSGDITVTLSDADGPFFSAIIPGSNLTPNRSGTRLRFRDLTGTIADGVTSFKIGGTLRSDVSLKARFLDLSGASAGQPFTATLATPDRIFAATGTLRVIGARLVYP